MGEDDEICDEDMDPSPTNPLDSIDPDFRHEPQMVRLDRWHYLHQEIVSDVDPRIRRLRAGIHHQLKRWNECFTECFLQERVSIWSGFSFHRKRLYSKKVIPQNLAQKTEERLITG